MQLKIKEMHKGHLDNVNEGPIHFFQKILFPPYWPTVHCNLPSSAVWTGRFYESAKVRLSPGVNKIEVDNKGSIKLELANEEGKWIWANEILI